MLGGMTPGSREHKYKCHGVAYRFQLGLSISDPWEHLPASRVATSRDAGFATKATRICALYTSPFKTPTLNSPNLHFTGHPGFSACSKPQLLNPTSVKGCRKKTKQNRTLTSLPGAGVRVHYDY